MLDLLEIRQEARSSKVESSKVQQETQKVTAVKQAGGRASHDIASNFSANTVHNHFLATWPRFRANLGMLMYQVKRAQSEVRNAREEKLVTSACQVRMGGLRFVDCVKKKCINIHSYRKIV